MSEQELRKKIIEAIEEFEKGRKNDFVPGETLIHYGGHFFDDKEFKAVAEVMMDSWPTIGKQAEEFEGKFSEFLGARHAVVANSGSSANMLAVSALFSHLLDEPLKAGDEVITPACTFPTTLNPLIQNNLKPVFLDVELDTYNINASDLEKAYSQKTRLIMLPHMVGNPNEMDAVMDFAEEKKLFVIEDTCDALGSRYNGKSIGTFGDLGTYSFYAAHHLTMGEGGAVSTNNSDLNAILVSLRDWGRCVCGLCVGEKSPAKNEGKWSHPSTLSSDYVRYVYMHKGFNFRPTEMQSAIGIAQLSKFPDFMKAREKNFKALYEEFSKYEEYFVLPSALPKAEPCWFVFPLTIKEKAGFKRRELIDWYSKHRIETRYLLAGNILKHPPYENLEYKVAQELKNTDYIAENSFFLGVYPGIDEQRMNFIIEKTREFMHRK